MTRTQHAFMSEVTDLLRRYRTHPISDFIRHARLRNNQEPLTDNKSIMPSVNINAFITDLASGHVDLSTVRGTSFDPCWWENPKSYQTFFDIISPYITDPKFYDEVKPCIS